MPETETPSLTKPGKFNPFALGGLRKQHNARWLLETDVAEMTLDVLDAGTYLAKFSAKEHADEYAYRKRMSVPVDMCRDGVRIRVDNLWRTPPKRDFEDSPYKDLLQKLVDDADNGGTSLDDFMRRALWNHYVTGVDIVTQSTSAPDGVDIVSRQDEDEQGIRPYFMQLTPLERNDWAVDGSRNFMWVRYCLGKEPVPDETGGGEDATLFLTLTGTEWRKHRAIRRMGSTEIDVQTISGTHGLGRPPVIKFYFSESQKAGAGGVPLSLLTRPAIVAKVAMNLKSQADADLLAAVPRWYVTGVGTTDLPDIYGPGVLMKLQDPASSIGVAQGDPAHIREKREWLLLYIGEILRLLKFRGGMAEIQANSGSGLKLAIERTDLDNEMRATAAQLEQTELEMMRQAVCLAENKDIPPQRAADELKYDVDYNTDFVLEPLGEMLSNIKIWTTECGFAPDEVPEITREMLRQTANILMGDGTDASKAAMEEIDAASLEGGTVKEEDEPEEKVEGKGENDEAVATRD